MSVTRLNCNGAELAVTVYGDGPPIVLLHGWPETSAAWHGTATALAEAGWSAIVPDLRGTGASERTPGGYGKDDQAEDLEALTQQLGLAAPFVLVGHDIGGMIAFAYARRHPQRVSHLVLVDLALPGLGLEAAMDVSRGGLWHFGFFMQPEVPAMLIADHEAEFFEWWFADQSATLLPAEVVAGYRRSYTGREALDASFGHYRTLLADGQINRAWIEAGGRLDLPVLAIGGEFSAGRQLGQSIASVCPQLGTQIVAGSGHFVPEERPAEFLAALLGFLPGPAEEER